MKISFQMPTPASISGRSSSITNSFINGIIPVITPTEAEIQEALDILQIKVHPLTCAYCGDLATEWDHLRPLVVRQRPTGYISEIANLVPACGKCNQSKGNKAWRDWISSSAPRSPKSRGIPDLEARIQRLAAFEKWRNVEPIDFEHMVGSDVWAQHWQNWRRILDEMKASQTLASQIRATIKEYHAAQQSSHPAPAPRAEEKT